MQLCWILLQNAGLTMFSHNVQSRTRRDLTRRGSSPQQHSGGCTWAFSGRRWRSGCSMDQEPDQGDLQTGQEHIQITVPERELSDWLFRMVKHPFRRVFFKSWSSGFLVGLEIQILPPAGLETYFLSRRCRTGQLVLSCTRATWEKTWGGKKHPTSGCGM